MQSPFEVYYGRQPHRVRNKLSLGAIQSFEVPEEGENEFQLTSPKKNTLAEWRKERDSTRDEALKASKNASEKMVKRELKRNPPSLYNVGETVLVRIAKTKKTVKGKKTTLKGACEAVILKADHYLHKYYVDFEDPNTSKRQKAWLKVDDITSLTKEEENIRQETAKERVGKRKLGKHNSASNSQTKVQKVTNGESLLDASIANILSSEMLKGDTINLYFDFLSQKWSSKKESICLASSYFYPSLDKPETSLSYTNYIGKDPLQDYENLVVPVHLPTEKHWLLAVISIIHVCIYIYDSAVVSTNTYNTIFQALKQKFIKRERQNLPQEQRTLLHEENWEEKIPSCPKQKNDVDCGVFTCYFAKQMALSDCNSHIAYEGDFRNEMVNDLLEVGISQ